MRSISPFPFIFHGIWSCGPILIEQVSLSSVVPPGLRCIPCLLACLYIAAGGTRTIETFDLLKCLDRMLKLGDWVFHIDKDLTKDGQYAARTPLWPVGFRDRPVMVGAVRGCMLQSVLPLMLAWPAEKPRWTRRSPAELLGDATVPPSV